ncbi:MAG TPA: hydroxyquinol 1,2-dioxygenase [Magnetospirillaceae bacterium]
MSRFETVFGSLDNYEKGHIEIINDKPTNYAFSNVFEVAAKSKPYEKVAVGKNQENLIEAIRAEGTSPWYTCAHDEFALVMDGEVEVHFIDIGQDQRAPAKSEGNVTLKADPNGKTMGHVVLKRGHQALLPANAAYQFRARKTGVVLQQALAGENTIYKWKDICLT